MFLNGFYPVRFLKFEILMVFTSHSLVTHNFFGELDLNAHISNKWRDFWLIRVFFGQVADKWWISGG